jgi:quercetin dioxygenase-like cupin family protein
MLVGAVGRGPVRPSLHFPTMDAQTPFEPIAVDLRDYVEFDLAGARGRRVFATDVVAVDVACLEPDQQVEPRAFPTADVIYTVVGGIAWVVTDEAEVTLTALQSVMIPAGVPHGLRNDSPDPLILQVVVSPPDEAPEATLGPAVPPDPETGEPPRPSFTDRLRRVLGG